MNELAAFLLLAIVLSVTPGPDAVLVLRSSVRGGRHQGLATAFGAVAGSLVWGVAAAAGLAAVITQSATLFQTIRLAGATYLIFLGISTLRTQVRGRPNVTFAAIADGDCAHTPQGMHKAFGAGLLSDLLNPKVGLFYIAVIPQFIPVGAPVLQYSLLLCAIEIVVALVWFTLLAWVAHVVLNWLRRPVVDRWLQAALGSSLIGIGATVAAEQ